MTTCRVYPLPNKVDIKHKVDEEPNGFINEFEMKDPVKKYDIETGSKTSEVQVESDPPKWYKSNAVQVPLKILLLLFCLYIFICSLDLMASGFQMLAGRASQSMLQNVKLLNFPVSCVMVGIIVTILVQSSSTSTSIFITMVASGILNVRMAIYMLMGANIGTTITNTIVSIVQIGNRKEFKLAFAAATVHDVFNWLSVIILLPLEVVSGYLYRLTFAIVSSMDLRQYKEAKQDLLKVITKPLTKLIIQIDKVALQKQSMGESSSTSTVMKMCCKKTALNLSLINETVQNQTCLQQCQFLFHGVGNRWTDPAIGGTLLFISLVLLISCLISLVSLLKRLLLSRMSASAKRFVNSTKLDPFTGYIALFVGMGMTILVQSSSVFTSALTPLVGTGFLSINLMYPLCLGSNIGTTITGILAALASDSSTMMQAMQAALTHLFFNISGILIWFPIPFMRKVPIYLAQRLGDTTFKYRWFAVAYLLIFYLLFPGVIMGLSLIHWIAPVLVVSFLVLLLIVVSIMTAIQNKRPHILPVKLRTWHFLPLCLRSLEPLDNLIMKTTKCCPCKSCPDGSTDESENETDK